MTPNFRERLGIALGIAGVLLFGDARRRTRLAVRCLRSVLSLGRARGHRRIAPGLTLLLVLTASRFRRARSWTEFVLAGICTIIGFPVLMALAMVSVPAAHGGVVLSDSFRCATAAAAALIAHERPSAGFWLASILRAPRIVADLRGAPKRRATQSGSGDHVFTRHRASAGAFGYTLSGRLSRTRPGWEVICWQVALISAAVDRSRPTRSGRIRWPACRHRPGPACSYVSFVSQFFALLRLQRRHGDRPASRSVGQLMLLQPFVIVALAAPVNGEPIQLVTLAYAAAVVATVAIEQRMRVTRG